LWPSGSPLEAHSGHIWHQASKMLKNEPPEAHSGSISHQAAEILKIMLLMLILTVSGTRQPTYSKLASCGSFWQHLAPGSQIYEFRLTAPWRSACEAINASKVARLD